MGIFDSVKKMFGGGERAREEAAARAFLELPAGYEPPPSESLIVDVRAILQTSGAMHGTGPTWFSPIWERGADGAVVRAVVLPPAFESRYFTGTGRATVLKASVIEMIAGVYAWMALAPTLAMSALDDTYKLWCSDGAPTKALGLPWRPQWKLLSLLLADIARKGDAGFDTMEWFASLGLPLDEFRSEGDLPSATIEKNTVDRVRALVAQEEAWFAAALTANEGG